MEANFKLQHMCHVNDLEVLDIFFFLNFGICSRDMARLIYGPIVQMNGRGFYCYGDVIG